MTENAMHILRKLPGFKVAGKNQWQARCPSHDDRKASLSISIGDDRRILLNCKAGCKTADVLDKVGLSMKDLFPAADNGHHRQSREVATYDYVDASGNLVYQVVRFDPKDFKQRRPDGKGG